MKFVFWGYVGLLAFLLWKTSLEFAHLAVFSVALVFVVLSIGMVIVEGLKATLRPLPADAVSVTDVALHLPADVVFWKLTATVANRTTDMVATTLRLPHETGLKRGRQVFETSLTLAPGETTKLDGIAFLRDADEVPPHAELIGHPTTAPFLTKLRFVATPRYWLCIFSSDASMAVWCALGWLVVGGLAYMMFHQLVSDYGRTLLTPAHIALSDLRYAPEGRHDPETFSAFDERVSVRVANQATSTVLTSIRFALAGPCPDDACDWTTQVKLEPDRGHPFAIRPGESGTVLLRASFPMDFSEYADENFVPSRTERQRTLDQGSLKGVELEGRPLCARLAVNPARWLGICVD